MYSMFVLVVAAPTDVLLHETVNLTASSGSLFPFVTSPSSCKSRKLTSELQTCEAYFIASKYDVIHLF